MSPGTAPPPPAPALDDTADLAAARACHVRGDHASALRTACAVLQRSPRSADAHVLLGELALGAPHGEPVAEKLFRQALELRPNDPVTQRLLATALLPQGGLAEATALLVAAGRSRPRDAATLLLLARVQFASGRLAEAERVLRAALALNPRWVDALNLLGDVLKKRGDLSAALTLHRRAAGAPDAGLPLATGRPRRAIILVQIGAAWASLASVHAALRADPDWEVTVVGLPFLHCHFSTDAERLAVLDFLRQENIPFVRWDEYRLQPGCADVVFLHLPYDETQPPGWRLADLLRSVPRLVYVPYALVIVGGSENTGYQFNLPLQQRAWMVAAHSARNRAMFTRHCATGDAHVVVTGHPKMDALRDLEAALGAGITEQFGGRRIVCWNPHFDVRPGPTPFGTGLSTFLQWSGFLLDEFARRPGLGLLIRPHPLFFSSLEKRRLWTAAAAAAFEARAAALPNVGIDRRPTYLPAFAASAAMLSDASSLLLEFAATGRPLLYLRNPHGPELNDHGALVRDHLYTAETAAGIQAFLDQVERGEDPRGPGRAQALPGYLFQPAGGAGAAILRAVNERLAAELAAAN